MLLFKVLTPDQGQWTRINNCPAHLKPSNDKKHYISISIAYYESGADLGDLNRVVKPIFFY